MTVRVGTKCEPGTAGNPVWIERWLDEGEEQRVAEDDVWLAAPRQALVAAVS